ncbi:MAG TPA: YgeY family selenium metabolism-linked hydrolase [Chroococcales cyanobacterium]|jgi:putative selenium metabolism hydrolase
MHDRFSQLVNEWRGDIVRFARDLIRTPSLSGSEGAIAEFMAQRMRELGYDEVLIDPAGNVVGVIRGEGEASVVLNNHMDSVDPGERSNWQHDPYGGEEVDGFLHGRGASDVKGAIAAQIYAGALLKKLGIPLRGNLVVTGVVQEEEAECIGIQYLCDETLPKMGIKPQLFVLGEATGLNLYLGHRGRLEMEVTTIGRTSHASAPWLGSNAVYKMLPVIAAIQELSTTLPSHPFLGKSTVTVTNVTSRPGKHSIIPDRCTASLDRRYLPSETLDMILGQIQSVLNRLQTQDPEFKGEVKVRFTRETTYRGFSKDAPKHMAPFLTSEDDGYVKRALGALEGIGEKPQFDKWYFNTDGSYTSGVLGIPTLGFGPGEEKYSHTPFDRVSIDCMLRAAAGSAAIAEAILGGK